jgi:glucan biosynthesis protein C
MSELTARKRLYFLDWIRVIAFGLLIFYHTGLIFVDWGFHIQNDLLSEDIKLPMLFLNQWRLPLLFFVSGAGIWFAFAKRKVIEFIRERFIRLFCPLAFGVLIMIPPQVYYEWLHHGTFSGSIGHFYPLFFKHITWNHLWFLAYLLVFTFIALPLFLYLRSEKNESVMIAIFSSLSKKHHVLLFLLLIPLLVIELSLRDHWPDTRNLVGDWYNFMFYLVFMVYGYVFASATVLLDSLEHNRKKYFFVGLFSFAVLYFGWHQPGVNFLEASIAGRFIFDFFKCLNILCWIFCLLGYSKHYLSKNSSRLHYANKAVYPFFILHQTVLITIGYYVIQLSWSIFLKYLVIVMGTFFLCFLFYELFIRRIKVLGFLFGVK